MKPLIAIALAAAALYAFLRRRPVASAPWADLERVPGFNERIRLGRAQLDAGQRVEWTESEDGVQPPDPRPLGLTFDQLAAAFADVVAEGDRWKARYIRAAGRMSEGEASKRRLSDRSLLDRESGPVFEPEDGVQPPDPRPPELTYSTPSYVTYSATGANHGRGVPYWPTAACGFAHPWGICDGHAG